MSREREGHGLVGVLELLIVIVGVAVASGGVRVGKGRRGPALVCAHGQVAHGDWEVVVGPTGTGERRRAAGRGTRHDADRLNGGSQVGPRSRYGTNAVLDGIADEGLVAIDYSYPLFDLAAKSGCDEVVRVQRGVGGRNRIKRGPA